MNRNNRWSDLILALYADSVYPVRKDLEAVHEKQLAQFGVAGAWGSGAQRLAVARETRDAGIDAGIYEAPDDPGPPNENDLPNAAKKVIHKLTVAPKDFLEDSYDEALAGGLSDAEFVEMVGIVARITAIDVFSRGIGVPLRPLPEAQPGLPSRERPQAAVQEQAFPPTIPNPPDGGREAEELYGKQPKPYIVRGLSLVPDELRMHVEQEHVQYLPMGKILQPHYQHHDGLSRAQAEIVAGRVSALNECFF